MDVRQEAPESAIDSPARTTRQEPRPDPAAGQASPGAAPPEPQGPPDGAPSRAGGPGPAHHGPRVLLEDLDAVEARRRALKAKGQRAKGSLEDPRLWRGLISFTRPHIPAMLTALLMSGLAAACKVGFVVLLEQVLRPLFESAGQVSLTTPTLRLLQQAQGTLGRDGLVVDLGGCAAVLRWIFDVSPPLTRLGWGAGGLVLLVIVEQANKYGQKLLMRGVSISTVRDVRAALFERLMALSMRFHVANHSGKLLSRLTSDLTKLGNAYVDFMVSVLSDAFAVVAVLWYVFAKGGTAVVLGLLIAVAIFVPVHHLGWRVRTKEEKNQRRMAKVFQNLAESLAAQKIVKAFCAEQHELQRFQRVNDSYTTGRMRSVALQARTEPLVEVVGAVGVAMFLYLGGRLVIQGSWDGAALFAIIMALIQVVASLRRLSGTITKLQGGLSAADRVSTVLYSEPEIVDAPDAVELDGFQHAIEYDHVWYAHEEGRPVLKDITFTLSKGGTLALVGHTGSGKSTVADLLPRFYDVDQGAVRIDGHDVRRVRLASLRGLIAVVTQETVLFEGTIASNIAYALPEASAEEIERAARAAHAHEFIERLPQGYDTPVGEDGMTLSGGERQRLAIARALLRNAPILILDEATSALDTRSERIVQEAIDALKAGRTTLVIAHRLSTIRDADQILVLDAGRVVESGTHEQLVAAGGAYARMVSLQGQDRAID